VPVALTAACGLAIGGIVPRVDVPYAIGFVHLVALAGIAPVIVLGAQCGAMLRFAAR